MDWKRIGIGAATGGQSEVFNALSGGGLFGGGGGGGAKQVPLETKEQRDARRLLLSFAETGRFGDFEAGAEVPVGLGDYRMTDMEGEGLTGLQSLLRSGIPDKYRLTDDALRDVLDTSPEAIERQFQPFRAQTERQMRDAGTALKRNLSYAGDLYSTDAGRQFADLEARGNETLSAEMARLTNAALDRRLQAVPLALQSERDKEATAMGRVDASQTYGSLTRRLNDASIKARDAELLRRRQELLLPIDAASAVVNAPVQFGVPSVETSPYQDLLAMVGQLGGTALGAYVGGPAGGAVGGRLGRSAGGWASNGGEYAGVV